VESNFPDPRYELKQLFGSIVGCPAEQVPSHWVYFCRNQTVAEAVTTRNAIEVLKCYTSGIPIRASDSPWHVRFNSLGMKEMIRTLAEDGYFGGGVAN